jgi:hypothetical protein
METVKLLDETLVIWRWASTAYLDATISLGFFPLSLKKTLHASPPLIYAGGSRR